jgi:ABC-type amino acid transport substrate-binding protein
VPRFRRFQSILVAFALVFVDFGAAIAMNSRADAAATGALTEPLRTITKAGEQGDRESQEQTPGAAQQSAAEADMTSDGCTLRAAVVDIPPYATLDAAGHWSGEAVELFRAVAQDMGCEVEFIRMSPSDILRALERDEIDAVALPFSASPLSASLMTLTPSFAT